MSILFTSDFTESQSGGIFGLVLCFNRTGSSDHTLCAKISGNVGGKKAVEERSYREDRGLIRD